MGKGKVGLNRDQKKKKNAKKIKICLLPNMIIANYNLNNRTDVVSKNITWKQISKNDICIMRMRL